MSRHEETKSNPRWQTNIKFPNEGIAHIYKTKKFADVNFCLGRRTFKAHLLILHARNSVLANEVVRSGDTQQGMVNVIIDDVSEDGFENLLHYIYTDKLEYTEESFLETFRAALKYQQNGMVEKCQAKIENWEITLENVYDLFEESFGIQVLRDHCIEFINNNTISFLNSPGFKLLSYVDVKDLIIRGHFQCVPTVTFLNGILSWANSHFKLQEDYQKVRQLLLLTEKPILGLLGIENLTYVELTELVSKCENLLTEKESLQFFIHAGNPSAPLPDWCFPG